MQNGFYTCLCCGVCLCVFLVGRVLGSFLISLIIEFVCMYDVLVLAVSVSSCYCERDVQVAGSFCFVFVGVLGYWIVALSIKECVCWGGHGSLVTFAGPSGGVYIVYGWRSRYVS